MINKVGGGRQDQLAQYLVNESCAEGARRGDGLDQLLKVKALSQPKRVSEGSSSLKSRAHVSRGPRIGGDTAKWGQ